MKGVIPETQEEMDEFFDKMKGFKHVYSASIDLSWAKEKHMEYKYIGDDWSLETDEGFFNLYSGEIYRIKIVNSSVEGIYKFKLYENSDILITCSKKWFDNNFKKI